MAACDSSSIVWFKHLKAMCCLWTELHGGILHKQSFRVRYEFLALSLSLCKHSQEICVLSEVSESCAALRANGISLQKSKSSFYFILINISDVIK